MVTTQILDMMWVYTEDKSSFGHFHTNKLFGSTIWKNGSLNHVSDLWLVNVFMQNPLVTMEIGVQHVSMGIQSFKLNALFMYILSVFPLKTHYS